MPNRISLFCTDETDGESLAACRQALEGLLVYNRTAKPWLPWLRAGIANEDVTEFTFNLRQHVQFMMVHGWMPTMLWLPSRLV
jgi:ABC-type transport system substrate-binding protein